MTEVLKSYSSWKWDVAKHLYDELKQKHGDNEEALWTEFLEFSIGTMGLSQDDWDYIGKKVILSIIERKPIEWN